MNSISRIVPIVCLTLVGACNSGKMERASEVSTDSLRSAVAVDIRQASSTDDARIQADRARAESARADVERDADARHRCKAAASLPQSIDKILAEPKDYVGNDSCAAVLADAVVARFIRSNDKQYLAVLDALSRAADSKSTELLGAAVLDLFRAKPIELVKHLYML
ncbi:MAG: hypothetical protein H7X80_11870, partial [bacterium]|nr:hypothetical protein [Candidatus Kapabacteria bacterium]